MRVKDTFEIPDPVEKPPKDRRKVVSQEDYDNIKKFVEGYQKLKEETGCSIGSCGCCNSPWLDYKDDIIDDYFDGYCDIDDILVVK